MLEMPTKETPLQVTYFFAGGSLDWMLILGASITIIDGRIRVRVDVKGWSTNVHVFGASCV